MRNGPVDVAPPPLVRLPHVEENLNLPRFQLFVRSLSGYLGHDLS